MSREEDLIRSTTRAIASTVQEVPPLRLEQATDHPLSPARAPRRPRGGERRRWWSWGAPLTAAAVVVALAIALVVVRDMPGSGAAPRNPVPSAGQGGVPRYYVALRQLAGDMNSPSQRNDLVVGDSLTGQTLATLAPPARTAFESVTGAADDRTFVIFAVTSSTGSFNVSVKGGTLTGSWFAVRLAPGTARPARLTHLPIKPITVPGAYGTLNVGAFVDSFNSVVSGSGQELAVPEWTPPHGGLAVKVFSVATGKLLHEWTANPATEFAQEPSLAWLDGDRTLALISRSTSVPPNSKFAVMSTTVREWPVAGPASGGLVAVSKVVWGVQITKIPHTTVQNCVEPVVGGPVVISADGRTFSCTTAGGSAINGHLSFHTYPLAASTTATAEGTVDYQVTLTKEQGIQSAEVLWASPSGSTLIGAFFPYDGSAAAIANGLRVGVISHGKFTPLRIPASLARSAVLGVAF